MGKWLGIIAAFILVLPGCGSKEAPTRQNDLTPLTSIVIEADLNSLAHGTSTRLIAMGNYSGLFTRPVSQVVWSIDQPSIADFVDNTTNPGRVRAKDLAAGAVTATITATTPEGITGSFSLTVTAADIDTVTVTSLSTSLPIGLTQAFTAQGTFSDATTQDLTFDALWASSASSIATVSNDAASKGVVKGVSKGVTEISATFDSIISEVKSLTITDPILLSIAVTSANSSLLSLSTQPYVATGRYSDGSTSDVSAIWDSSNKAVATFATDTSTVKTLTQGTTTISATLGTVSGTSSLKVTGGNLTGITLTLNSAINNGLINGTSSRVIARGNFSNNTSRDITGAITTWAMVPTDIVTFSPVGVNPVWVNAVKTTVSATPATLTATYGSVTENSSLTVTAPTLDSVSIPEQTLTLSSGTSGQLSLKGNSSSQDLTSTAVWSSGDLTIATIGNAGLDKGRVHAVAPGTAVITAIYGSLPAAPTTVTVVNRTLVSLTISPVTTSTTILAGTEIKFKVTALYSDGLTQDVTADAAWTIDNQNFAKFSDQLSDPGLVVAVDAGTATLTAAFGGMSVSENLVVSQ